MLSCELLKILSVLVLFNSCIGKDKTITVSSVNCGNTYSLDADDEYTLEYNGAISALSTTSSCIYKFLPESPTAQLCVKAKKFDVSCQLKVMYHFVLYSPNLPDKSYSCKEMMVNDSCSLVQLIVEFNKDTYGFSKDHVILRINATEDELISAFAKDVMHTVYLIIGVVVAVIVVIVGIIVTVVCCCCIRRQRRSRGQVYHPPQAVAVQMQGQPVPQPQPVLQPAADYERLQHTYQQPAQFPYLPSQPPVNPLVEYAEPSSYPPPPKGSSGYPTMPSTVPYNAASAPAEEHLLPPSYPGN